MSRFIQFGLFFLLTCPSPAAAETLFYRVTVGDQSVTSEMQIQKHETGLYVTDVNIHEASETRIESDGNTLEWKLVQFSNGKKVSVTRRGDSIVIDGQKDGKSFHSVLALEGKPWFQNIGLCAAPFLWSGEKSRSFRIINPADLGIVKLKIEKMEITNVTMAGRQRRAQRLELRSDNVFLQALWKADYWLDADSGEYLRYEGINGGPGTPKTTVELRQP
jgi:hypothetical protein